MDNKKKLALQKALDEFIVKVDLAKADYNSKINKILQTIDDKKISKAKSKLNI